MKLGAVGILAYRTYVLGELIEATNNFHRSTCMGDGSHGQVIGLMKSRDILILNITNMKFGYHFSQTVLFN